MFITHKHAGIIQQCAVSDHSHKVLVCYVHRWLLRFSIPHLSFTKFYKFDKIFLRGIDSSWWLCKPCTSAHQLSSFKNVQGYTGVKAFYTSSRVMRDNATMAVCRQSQQYLVCKKKCIIKVWYWLPVGKSGANTDLYTVTAVFK